MPLRSRDREATDSLSSKMAEQQISMPVNSMPLNRYVDLFFFAPVSYCTLNRNAVILDANRAAGRLLGQPARELAGQSLLAFVLEEDRPIFETCCSEAHTGAMNAACELRIAKPDGPLFWISLIASQPPTTTSELHTLIMMTDVSAQKETEGIVRESDDRLKHVIEAAREGIWDWDIASGRVYYSPQWAHLLGYSPDEVPPRVEFFLSHLHPEDLPSITRVLDEHLAGRTSEKQHEVRLRMKSGEYRWFMDRGRVVARCDAGSPLRMVGTITDITERKQTESALKESETRTQLLLKAASLGLWDWNLVTNDVYFSREWKQQLGYEDHEIPNRFEEWQCRLCPEDLDRTFSAVQEFCAGRRLSYDVEFRMRHRDGSWRWICARADLARDLSGKPVRMMGCHFDVTERKQAEEALLESEMRLREAQAISRIGNFHWNARTGRVTWSDQLFRIYGRSRTQSEPSLESYIEAVHPDDRSRIVQAIQTAMQTKTGFEHEYRLAGNTQEPRWVQARGVLLLDNDGCLLGLEGTCQEISDRKLAEAAHASLEAQLRESQKMEAIGTLAGGIAHDFNNILAAILGNIEIVGQELPDARPAALKSLEDIRVAGTRARNLVQQILSFSRRQPTDRHPISLQKVLEESSRLLRATLPARLSLHVMCSDNVPFVMADATQIEQVLLNLATNAMQAMNTQHGEIRISLDTVQIEQSLADTHPVLRALQVKHAGRAVRLVVRDNGPGMDAATRSRIFEPFFTTKPVDHGTGLGLSVVHGIIQSHEGAILVHSQPGEGAEFTIYLPALTSQQLGTAQHDGAADMKHKATVLSDVNESRTPRHILYLDDDSAVLILVKRLLERRGYRVSCFSDQHEALNTLRLGAADFHVVVTDYNMPGMQGLEVARQVRAIRPDLPVAVTSGFIDEELQEGAKEAGVRQLISKPFAIEDFYLLMETL